MRVGLNFGSPGFGPSPRNPVINSFVVVRKGGHVMFVVSDKNKSCDRE